jgi:HTH-type transcriptional regulator / antitoxin HipB
MELKDLVKYHRKEAELSRRQLAEFSGVSTTFLSDLEGGKETLQFNKVVAVLETLNISLVYDSPLMNALKNEAS